MLPFDIPDPNMLNSETDYVMHPQAQSVWVEVDGLSINIERLDAGIKVNIYPLHDEMEEPLDYARAEYDAVTYSDEALEQLWDEFGNDVGCDDDGITDAPFLHFPAGIDREDIWHWFNDRHSKGVAWLLNERGAR